ncbi:MAG: replication initiation protein RepC [Hyphomicrobiales bacterium]
MTAVNRSGHPGPEAKATDRTGAADRISILDLKQSCPEFSDYTLNGLNTWRDAVDAAELARPMLGISRDAWLRAQQAMGSAGAVMTIAYLIERVGEIKSAGGYLRALTDKAEAGKLRLRPMLDSLLHR